MRIDPHFEPKVWGSTGLSPWFADTTDRIGEVIFRGDGVPLMKFLFTTDRMSVQVHPDDAYAREHGLGNGKTEMWYVMRAAPGAQVGVGFRRALTQESMREAIEEGTVDSLLNWVIARPGDVFFVPGGTVHAIGAGLTLCEIQQHSDTTFRLYDYGRPRELHIEEALAVARLGPTNPRSTLPVRCPFFHTEYLESASAVRAPVLGKRSALIALQGEGLIGEEPFLAGMVFEIPAETSVQVVGRGTFLRTYFP